MCFFSVSVNPLLTVLNTMSNPYGIKNWRPLSFVTRGALAGRRADVRVVVVCGDSCSLSALVLVVIIVITIVVVVVVVLDTGEPVAVVLDQIGVTEPQLLQLLPQLIPLLLLLLLPLPICFIGGSQLIEQRAVHLHQCLQHVVD